ncbi:pyridoxamine 5'-phosphate oxidase [Gilvimarinus sp. DA14]|uniref:pyridoxamine 5'-phosphate oxidase n=1 Tax=Gilvimarinus sp. DA14 TaxID=2956798 RepID=UPI0020B64ACB|nr:pyridoxamine 5'-phosphate oxidase [Gilvimarinus sp. DA14]UTF61464.1 pyridoxamine 5'-phosphate oxidase [Gilvimarinus sp. DA14]
MSNMYETKRREYTQGGLRRADLAESPYTQFERWFEQAEAGGVSDPTAMVLATASPGGQPSQRIVLLKQLDERGFVFFTNYNSRKGRDLAGNPKASVLFPWHMFDRQVKVCGLVEKLERTVSEAYFSSRPRTSQLAAWASPQSDVIASREQLETNFRELDKRYADADIPTPAHWGGYRLVPTEVEFWQGGAHRLHDCFRYRYENNQWLIDRVGP